MLLKLCNYFPKTLCQRISTSAILLDQKEVVKRNDDDYSIKEVQKKPTRLPLAKNFFLGRVDTELLAYPEAIYENDYLAKVKNHRDVYEEMLNEYVFKNPDDKNNIDKLKDLDSFQIPPLLLTERLLRLTEVENKHLSYSTFLNNHRNVIKLISDFGDSNQKLKYLPKLEIGDFIGVPAVFEYGRSVHKEKLFNTEAKFKDNIDKWILNGEKSFTLISPVNFESSLFVVLASTESEDRKGDIQDSFTIFLVEGNSPGVTVSRVDNTIGMKEEAFNQVRIGFKNVELDKSQILSQTNPMLCLGSIMNLTRLTQGALALNGIMKPLLNELTKHSINTVINGLHMKDVDTIKDQLGSLVADYYSLESMIYMTAGLTDIYDKQDVEVESAMVQSYAIQVMSDFVMRPLHAVGSKAACEGSPYAKYIRDSIQFAANGEYLDSVKQYLSLAGLNFAGVNLEEYVRKDRNPFHHPNFIFSKLLLDKSIDKPKRTQLLHHYLHPSLEHAGNMLEDSILRLGAAVDILLGRHGSAVVQHTVETAKIADAATLCYAMFCVAARASRSYCIGLKNADQEMNLANVICYMHYGKIHRIAKEIDEGEYGTTEHMYKSVGERLIESKEYHFEHPTARNF